jgi:hypothetical protein
MGARSSRGFWAGEAWIFSERDGLGEGHSRAEHVATEPGEEGPVRGLRGEPNDCCRRSGLGQGEPARPGLAKPRAVFLGVDLALDGRVQSSLGCLAGGARPVAFSRHCGNQLRAAHRLPGLAKHPRRCIQSAPLLLGVGRYRPRRLGLGAGRSRLWRRGLSRGAESYSPGCTLCTAAWRSSWLQASPSPRSCIGCSIAST